MSHRFLTSIAVLWAVAFAFACVPEPDGDDGGSLADSGTTEQPSDAGGSEEDAGPVVLSDAGRDAGSVVAPPIDSGTEPAEPDAGPPPDRGVRVEGNRILKDGVPIQIRGVNRSGTEFACVQRGEIFDGPADDASLAAIVAWGANAVRIPLNETCWLGINGVAPAASGAAYRDAILAYVDRVKAHGMIPILDLHWAAPGDRQATEQLPMPNRDHTPELWRHVADTVKDDPYVVLELFNEPWPDWNQDTDAAWRCWRDGGSCGGIDYQAAGMQELVDAVRSTGAENVILAGGIRFANTLSQWLAYRPTDPLGQLAAAWHIYSSGFCADQACYDGSPAAVAAAVPVVATEIGDEVCGSTFMPALMDWLDAHDAGYMAWVWNTWTGCMRLIDSYDGTPRGSYGRMYRDRLQSYAD